MQARDTAHTGPIDDLILPVAAVRLSQDIAGGQLSRHRLIDIEDGPPDLGMLQCQRTTQPP